MNKEDKNKTDTLRGIPVGRSNDRIAEAQLLERCTAESFALLRQNLTPHGILAASRGEAAEARRYTRIFGRDVATARRRCCSGDAWTWARGAVASLEALAAKCRRQRPDPEVRRPPRR